MQFLHYVSGPVIGAVVGYITNYIAIKMLFRPTKPVMIGRFRVPFTPGIVPKRKDALAEILGRAIVDKFFNADDLEIIFTSDTMTDTFADCVIKQLEDEKFMLSNIQLKLNRIDSGLYKRLQDELCIRVQAAMLRANLPVILDSVAGKMIEKRSGSSGLGKTVYEELLAVFTEPLAEKLEKFILTEGRSAILPIINDELSELGAAPISELVSNIFPDPAKLHQAARELHMSFMSKFVRPIVESIDVGGMITEKVKLMSALEVEGLVLDVVNRELRYVVLLGALLGALIGAINIFI